MSGGQRAKVILAKLLLEKPDVLLLDEPTNFLDKDHVAWLAEYLSTLENAFLVVSHDFSFLDKIANRICDIDNDTITRVLVPCIAEARKRRQIIIVTHNPNLAVVCDAEQVIYCEIQKNKKNTVIYESGSLENPKINKRVTDILEGTMKAFRIRDNRYIEE